MSTVLTTWRLARTIASRVAQSADIADLARELCGQPLTVYLDGLPADRRGIAANYPALVVTAQSGGEPQGGPYPHVVRALLLLDAAAGAPGSAVPVEEADGVRVLAGGEAVSRLADAILDLVRDPATQLGSRVVDSSCELDLASSWPLRLADLTINLEDLGAF